MPGFLLYGGWGGGEQFLKLWELCTPSLCTWGLDSCSVVWEVLESWGMAFCALAWNKWGWSFTKSISSLSPSFGASRVGVGTVSQTHVWFSFPNPLSFCRGVNMYAMLTGTLPFTVEPFSLRALYQKMVDKEMNPLPTQLSTGNISGSPFHSMRQNLICSQVLGLLFPCPSVLSPQCTYGRGLFILKRRECIWYIHVNENGLIPECVGSWDLPLHMLNEVRVYLNIVLIIWVA